MNQVWHLVKLATAVITGFAALVCLFVAMPYVISLGVVSLAFSNMPE